MTEQFLGCTISIEVRGGLGFYQGIVKSVNTTEQLVTLIKVLHNGKPNSTNEVIISAVDIIDLKILHSKGAIQVSSTEPSQKHVVKNDNVSNFFGTPKIQNAANLGLVQMQPKQDTKETVSSNIKESSQKSGFKPVKLFTKDHDASNNSLTSGHFAAKLKPRTSVGETLAYGMLNNNNRNGANYLPDYGVQRKNFDLPKTPNKRLQWKKYRDETTFGTPIDEDVLSTEFDFEKNLALFDKQAVMEEIQSLQPDVIKQADRNSERKYRCDKNVIVSSQPPQSRQIIVPAAEAGEIIFVTDNGLLVPSITSELRMNLLSTANQYGLTKSRQLEMIGRAATEIILSVIGGSHRLEPGNSHQAPMVVIMCGANMQGAAGANCGRQLESHGVQTVVTIPSLSTSQKPSLLLAQETQLYSMTTGRITTDPNCLPSTVDLIVDARFDLDGSVASDVETSSWVSALNLWALSSRAPMVALDPPTSLNLPFNPRILLSPALPLSYLPEKGKVYLLNLNIPQQVFESAGIKYTPPFGSKMVIPLHPCD